MDERLSFQGGRWGKDYEVILEQIRQNAVNQAVFHKKRYFVYVKLNQYFQLPTIILSSCASVSAIGLQPYILQEQISGLVCLINLLIATINSIQIFLKISETCEAELETSRNYYHLATDIHKILSLEEPNRPMSGKECLDDIYRRYVELYESSNLLSVNYKDTMITLPKKEKNRFLTKTAVKENPLIPTPPSSVASDEIEDVEEKL
jgi:hypothetical protein